MTLDTEDFYEIHQSYRSNFLSDPFAEKIPKKLPSIFYVAGYQLSKRLCNRCVFLDAVSVNFYKDMEITKYDNVTIYKKYSE